MLAMQQTLSLPMYKIGAVRAAYGRIEDWLANALSQRLGTQITAQSAIENPLVEGSLVITQVCGYPYVHELRDTWLAVATPTFSFLPSDPPGHYHSVIIAPRDTRGDIRALSQGVIAVSERRSQSGHHALIQKLAEEGVKQSAKANRVLETGSHAQSLRAVALAEAQLAAVDAVSFHLLKHSEPTLCAKVREVARTPPTPGLPIVLRRDMLHLRPHLLELLQSKLGSPDAVDVGWSGWATGLDYEVLRLRSEAAASKGWKPLI